MRQVLFEYGKGAAFAEALSEADFVHLAEIFEERVGVVVDYQKLRYFKTHVLEFLQVGFYFVFRCGF